MLPFQFDQFNIRKIHCNRSEIDKWKILGSNPDKKLFNGNLFFLGFFFIILPKFSKKFPSLPYNQKSRSSSRNPKIPPRSSNKKYKKHFNLIKNNV